MVRKLIRSLYHYYLVNVKFRGKYVGSRQVDFSHTSKIITVDGSLPDDVQLSDGCRVYGSLMSQNGGQIVFSKRVQLGYSSRVMCSTYIEIGEGTLIANDTEIVDNNNHPVNPRDRWLMCKSSWDSLKRRWTYSDSAPIIIGKNVWIGSDVRICKGVTIGDGSVIAACSVVTHSCPPNCIMAGNPARIVKENIDTTTKRYFEDEDEENGSDN